MKVHLLILLFLISIFPHCKIPKVNPANTIDPDIILINIEEGDREFISKLLLKIDSLNPIAIGMDAMFVIEKDPIQDSHLKSALHKLRNDFLVYYISDDKEPKHSIQGFRSEVTGEGFIDFYEYIGLVSEMTPVAKIKDELHESFALKMVKAWKPELKFDFSPNESITINYTRPLESFFAIQGSDILQIPIQDFELPNKIILIGYLGPKQQNMFRTPFRLIKEEELKQNVPDTYGLVILANQIRTLLEYGKK
jgi:CHASE2 domain-containing sensor protein